MLSVFSTHNHHTYPPDHLNNLMSLTINCQSLLAKKESHMNLISVHNPDIIFSTEYWLKADISSNEVFPTGYSVVFS